MIWIVIASYVAAVGLSAVPFLVFRSVLPAERWTLRSTIRDLVRRKTGSV